MNGGTSWGTKDLTRATYDATLSNLFVNMEILRLTEKLIDINLENVALQRGNGEKLQQILQKITLKGGEHI